MGITVAARAHRILRGLRNWHPAPLSPDPNEPPLGSGEELLGCYDNGAGTTKVWVSSEAVWLQSGGEWRGMKYDEMVEVLGPGEGDPRDAAGVWIRSRDDTVVEIPVLGGNDRFRDAWEFTRFLQRVVEDRQPRAGN